MRIWVSNVSITLRLPLFCFILHEFSAAFDTVSHDFHKMILVMLFVFRASSIDTFSLYIWLLLFSSINFLLRLSYPFQDLNIIYIFGFHNSCL